MFSVLFELDDHEADFSEVEVRTAIQVRVHGIEAKLTISTQSGPTMCHEFEEI